MTMLKRENLSDRLADIIGDKIIHHELISGEALSETRIAKEWGVSRSPVRDALRVLEQKRLVERTRKGRYRVADFSIDFIRDFYESITVLLQYAFSKASERAARADLCSLDAAMKTIERSLKENDVDMHLRGVTAFASGLLKAAGNPIVERMALELMPSAERIQWAAINHSPKHFETLVRYIQQGRRHIKDGIPHKAAKTFADFARLHKTLAMESLAPGR